MLTFLNFPNPRAIAASLARGPAYTAVIDGRILASGGILPFWKGVGEAWIVSSELVSEHRVFFAKAVWRILNQLIIDDGFERVQTTVDAEHKVSIKWLERMGFEYEGTMRKFIGGRDHYRYARVRE